MRLVAIAQQLARLESQKRGAAPALVQKQSLRRRAAAKRDSSRSRKASQTDATALGGEENVVSAGCSGGSSAAAQPGEQWEAPALRALVGMRVSVLRDCGNFKHSFFKVGLQLTQLYRSHLPIKDHTRRLSAIVAPLGTAHEWGVPA